MSTASKQVYVSRSKACRQQCAGKDSGMPCIENRAKMQEITHLEPVDLHKPILFQ